MNIKTIVQERKAMSTGAFLIAALMISNVLNFVFNAYLGRKLSPADFGTVTVINTIVALVSIFIGSIANTVNHHTAFVREKRGPYAGLSFLSNVQKYSIYISLFFSIVWLVALHTIAVFFNIESTTLLLYCTPFILFSVLSATNKGFVQGNFKFGFVAIATILEALSKFIFVYVIVEKGYVAWAALSIPLSIFIAYVVSWYFTNQTAREIKSLPLPEESLASQSAVPFSFPKRFYFASVLAGLSTAVFLSVDVILAKHYFSPDAAGVYSLLSLVGKMIFFLGSLLNVFIITLVSTDEGRGVDPTPNFYKLFGGMIILVGGSFIALGPLGHIFIPFLFGVKALPILPYLTSYSLGISLFTIGSSFVIFHLARKQYLFSFIALFISGLFTLGIVLKHANISNFIHVLLWVSIINLVVMIVLHVLQNNKKFLLANVVDLVNVFYPLPKALPVHPEGKRILIFNWRDTKHAYAGGAENYIHELAKRWAAQGHAVTLFCGNDGHNTIDDCIDGVQIHRRGGTYTVYLWGFIYYTLKFRGRFDVIIDSQNGIPFFTPLYAKEKVFSLLHHVHQDIFYKFLPKPLAFIGATLENRAMPFVYQNTRFITVSESTKKDMERLDITEASVDIVYPGIDLSFHMPGEKADVPTVLSLGRLKAYKSIHILIEAFKQVLEKVPNARLLIAGDGEERSNLEELTRALGLENRVEFLGRISEEEKIKLFQKAWVFVNPSMMEGWGITTIEANACGTPVVASNSGGLKDSVRHQETGFLVEYGDVTGFAEKITTLLTDTRLRETMGKKAIEWSQNFEWNNLAEKCFEIIK